MTTPPEGLRHAADLLDEWANGGGRDDQKLNAVFVEICATHDALLDLFRRKPQFAGVVQERESAHAGVLRERAEQAEVQLAGCGAAAMGAIAPRAEEAKPGDYGYSASYGDVVKIRRELEELRERVKPKEPF